MRTPKRNLILMTENCFYKKDGLLRVISYIFILIFTSWFSIAILGDNEAALAFNESQLSQLKNGEIYSTCTAIRGATEGNGGGPGSNRCAGGNHMENNDWTVRELQHLYLGLRPAGFWIQGRTGKSFAMRSNGYGFSPESLMYFEQITK